MKKLIKSYKFWTALAGAVGLLVVAIGKACGVSISAKGAEEVIMSICGVLVVFGIVKKPKEKETGQENSNQTTEDTLKEIPTNQRDDNTTAKQQETIKPDDTNSAKEQKKHSNAKQEWIQNWNRINNIKRAEPNLWLCLFFVLLFFEILYNILSIFT